MTFLSDLEHQPDYLATASLDELRRQEYPDLDARDQVYLDYTGAGLFAQTQIREHLALIQHEILGNPHSTNLSSTATTTLVEGARRAVLEYFNGRDDYTAVFTLNASGALKLVGESFPFEPGGRLLLTFDNHNSVNGIREFALAKGAAVEYTPMTLPDLRIDLDQLAARLDAADAAHPNLFAYPAQSNFSGVRHSLDLVKHAHDQGWHVLLDAAAFVPTNRLDLAQVKPDFAAVSFYKMFGYPTGVGCLLARTSSLARLQRPWYAGGTVNFATVQGRVRVLSPREAGFEDGTLNFLSVPAVEIGLRYLDRVDVDIVHRRVACLTEALLAALLDLRHGNGRHMVRIYGPTSATMRGGTVTFNCYDPDGHLIDYRRVEELANTHNISLRTGCFCNPGAGELAEGLTEDDMREAATAGEMNLPRFVQFMQHRGGKSAGAIRASLGIASNARDIDRFVRFIASLRDQTRLTLGEVSFDIESCRVIRDGS